MPATVTFAARRAAFRTLHAAGCFVMPNPWDAGSARALAQLGFPALASTSAGLAWSCGKADAQAGLESTLGNLRALVACCDLPVNADFESGFADTPDALFRNVGLAIDTGIAGLSIEDSTNDPGAPLRPLDEAVARLRAARAAIDAVGGDVVLTGRAENFFVGQPDFDDCLRRLCAYAEAGADCLYAPGIRSVEQIRSVLAAVAPLPVNVLIGWPSELSVADLAGLGVRRISVGGALARTAWQGFLQAARQIATDGRFDGFAASAPASDLNGMFAAPRHGDA